MRHNITSTSHRGGLNFHIGKGADYSVKPQADGSYSQEQLYKYLWDIRFEPRWRQEAEIDNAYYDGDQLKQATLRRMQELGIPPIVINMVAPAIDSVSGWEATARSDLIVRPESEENYETATALNEKLKEAMRLTRFNHWVGMQFRQAITTGISWLEVGRNPDPFGYDYKVSCVPWREMYFDYRARAPDFEDARYIVRRKWYDYDELTRHFPRKKNELMKALANYGAGWLNEWESTGRSQLARDLASALHQEIPFTLEDDEYRQQHRGRVPLYEMLYYVPESVEVIRRIDGFSMVHIPNHPLHRDWLATGQAQLRRGVTKTWRQAYYAGPERLVDRQLPNGKPHYIPMVAYRRNSDGGVYGLVRRMRSPQEAINARHSRLIYDTASRKYMVDDDAVDNHEETARELNKIMSYVVLKSGRIREGLTELPTTQTSTVTAELLAEAKRSIYEVSGLHPEFQGRATSADRSGVAIQSLIEETEKSLGVVVDNYRRSKVMAGELLLQLIVDDLDDQDNVEVDIGDRKIVLNRRAEARLARDNDVIMVKTQVALGETPASATYQQQKFQSLVEIVKSMPDEMQANMIDLVVRAAALPDGEEIIERIRAMTGMGPEPKDPVKRQQLEQEQRKAQAQAARVEQLEMRMAQAEVALKEAQAQQAGAQASATHVTAEKTAGVDTDLQEAKIQSELAKAGKTAREIDQKDRAIDADLIKASAELRARLTSPEQAK